MIELEQISKQYQTFTRKVHALKGVTFQVQKGEAILITGPSGSGKSTLLGVLSGLIYPTDGKVRFEGEDLYFLPDRFISQLRQKRFAYVFQQHQLVEELSVAENVSLPLLPQNLSYLAIKSRVDRVLAQLDIEALARARVKTLSGGEQQRVAIARALAGGGDILIADEPTASLDPLQIRKIIELLKSLKDEGQTIVVSSHDTGLDALKLWDRKLAVTGGEIGESNR